MNDEKNSAQVNKNDEMAQKLMYEAMDNPEKILKARKDESLKELLNSATYQIPDGVGVIYASKIKKGKIRSRVTGIDCMEMLCNLSNEKGYKIFMYGAKEEVINLTRENFLREYPNLNIVYTRNGYFDNENEIIEEGDFTFLPLRETLEVYGASLSWAEGEAETKVIITAGQDRCQLVLDLEKELAYGLDGKEFLLRFENGTLYLPVHFLCSL